MMSAPAASNAQPRRDLPATRAHRRTAVVSATVAFDFDGHTALSFELAKNRGDGTNSDSLACPAR
jgi:hypothetical protein